MEKDIKWINCAKFMAILGVLMDHTMGILYGDQRIGMASYYSVSLFILISGMLCYSSNIRSNLTYVQTIVKTCKKIVLAYLFATLVYQIARTRCFDLVEYLNYVIRFNASSPFYYVLLYIQLMFVNKFLFSIVTWNRYKNHEYRRTQEVYVELLTGGGCL